MKKFPKDRKSIIENIAIRRWLRSLKSKKGRKKPHHLFQSQFLDFLYRNKRFHKTPTFSKGVAEIIIPKYFSFFYEPETVIDVINSIINLRDVKKIKKIRFDHRDCVTLDLSASAIMDLCVVDLRKVWKSKNRRFSIDGIYPNDKKITEILKETGLINHLRVRHESLTHKEKEKFIKFKLIKGGKNLINPYESTKSEIVSGKVAKYFDECLMKYKYNLTGEGKLYISGLVSEILDNAEQHSSISEWYVIGYLRDDGNIGECNISIFNIGETIYQSFNNPNTAPELLSRMNKRSKKHEPLFSKKWTKESLWTLYSLQDGVSRFNFSKDGILRGQGTVDMIEFFFKIEQKNDKSKTPRMTILSGSTLIKFDGEYQLKYVNYIKGKRKVIAFNKKNDLDQRPDSNAVKTINRFFPGTIIDMKFYIDEAYLSKII